MNQNYDIIPIPISIKGSDGRYIYVKAWCDMFSLDIQNALGFTDTELKLDPLAFPEGEPGSSVGEYSFRDVFITTREKGRLLLELIETRIDEAKGSSKIMCVHQDMTGIGWRMEDMSRNLQRCENRAKQNLQQITRLVRDTREPVDQMITFCDKLDKSTLDSKQKGMLTIIRDNARTIQRNMHIDTDTSVYDDDTMSTSDETVLVEPMICEVIKLYENVARDKHVTISKHISDELAKPVVTDSSHTRQIVVNMLESAIRGSKDGNVRMQAQMVPSSNTPLLLKVTIENPRKPEKGCCHDRSELSLGLSYKILRGLCGIVGGRLEICCDADGSKTLKIFLRATSTTSDNRKKS